MAAEKKVLHKWTPIFNKGLEIKYGKRIPKYWECECGVTKRIVTAGTRYDKPDGTFILNQAPKCMRHV